MAHIQNIMLSLECTLKPCDICSPPFGTLQLFFMQNFTLGIDSFLGYNYSTHFTVSIDCLPTEQLSGWLCNVTRVHLTSVALHCCVTLSPSALSHYISTTHPLCSETLCSFSPTCCGMEITPHSNKLLHHYCSNLCKVKQWGECV